MRRLLSSVALLGWLSSVGTAQAQTVVYDNGPPSQYGGRDISQGYSQASDFQLASTKTINSFGFWAYPGTNEGTLSWWFQKNSSANAPGDVVEGGSGTVAFSGTYYGQVNSGGQTYNSYYYEVNVGSLELGPGTYWLVLSHTWPTASTQSIFWQGTMEESAYSTLDDLEKRGTSGWNPPDAYERSFKLFSAPDSTVPEPVSLVLLGTGLLGVAAARRRKRR